jgi:3',5'-cyclic AMP phosphodiesterase CpdA
VYDQGKIQLTWIGSTLTSSEVSIKNPAGEVIFTKVVTGELIPEIFYTATEKNQIIVGLEKGSWLQSDQAYRYQVQVTLPAGINVTYRVTLGGFPYESSFKTPKDKNDWEKIRFVALADSETDPRGRFIHREWFPGKPLIRPFVIPQLWKDKFGVLMLEGFEIPNYFLSEQKGYAENLKIINTRDIDFMVMPGDLVQGGGYQPGWDEFFRHNAGEFDQGFSRYPIIPSFGNWENFGGMNGGYGDTADGKFAPVISRKRYHAYFKTPVSDPLQKHSQSYYRSDYGPITILTVDSSNGTPDQLTSDFDGVTKLKGKEFTVPGTDTQENYTEAIYKARGGDDLSSFGPGTDQYIWLEANLKEASDAGQLIFVQYHHIAFSSGEHGVPLNHDLSVGQVGTPMQILNPLFEQFGVIAVLSGHDELFERSFVDEDSDGKGVLYYDVGVAGDGIRSVKRDWRNNPLKTLDYNPYSKWTADQKSVERWNTSGPRPILTDGGKHYGHLEVNLEKIIEGEETFAKIKFSPIYAFPVMDENYNLVRVERRVYADELELKIKLKTVAYTPIFKEEVIKKLDEAGKVSLVPSDFLSNYSEAEGLTFTYSESTEFSCADLGDTEIQINAKSPSGEIWDKAVKVKVLDDIKPLLITQNRTIVIDRSKGAVEINSETLVKTISDNCGIKEIVLNSSTITCEDIGKTVVIEVTATDLAGNITKANAQVSVSSVNSRPVTISGNTQVCKGAGTVLTLNSPASFEVVKWRINGFEIPDQKGKALTTEAAGNYDALIRYQGACLEETVKVEVKVTELPAGEITKEDKILIAPLAESYQWYRNGEKINGATAETYQVTQSGEYTVEISNATGCKAKLKGIAFSLADFNETVFPPIKSTVVLELNQDGKTSLKSENLFETYPLTDPGIIVSIAKAEFSCEDLGENPVKVTLTDSKGQTSIKDVVVLVKDTLAPTFIPKSLEVELDISAGKLELNPESFYSDLRDNCGVKEIRINRNSINCEDLGKEIPIEIRAVDFAGNVTEKTAQLTVKGINSAPVTIAGPVEFCAGSTSQLTINSTAAFEVLRWRRNGAEIPDQKGKVMSIGVGGNYDALIRYQGACLEETVKVEVKVTELPAGEITKEDKILIAPLAESYQWYRNGEKINGATAETYQVTQSGEYTVEISNATGCKAKLKGIAFSLADFNETVFPPIKSTVVLELNQDGKTSLKSENLFETYPLTDPGIIVSIAKAEFSCEDLGENPVKVTLTDSKGQTSIKDVVVLVKDTLAPTFIPKSLEVELDISAGKLELNPESFYSDLRDNCGVKEIRINRNSIDCEDLGKEIPIEIRAVDFAGNVTEKTAQLTVKGINSAPVTIAGPVEFCAGSTSQLTINSAAAFEVLRWRRNGAEIPDQKGKVLSIGVGGNYDAVIRYQGACLAETANYEVKMNALPTGEIKADGNKLVAPAGDFTYQWFRNEVLIPEATQRVITLFEMGSYSVELTSAAGCKAKLKAVEVTIAGLIRPNMILSEELKTYPNPATNRIQLELETDQPVAMKSVRIYSLEGKEVTGIIAIQSDSGASYQLDISAIAVGTYIVMLEGAERKVFIGKFVKR